MPEQFDPYYTWLAIPPEEQPPDYYRLLGVRRFEVESTVIANAANQRLVHLRLQTKGVHARLAKQLANEVIAARTCLLDAQARSSYDAQLRSAMQLHAADLARAEREGGVSMTLGAFLNQVKVEHAAERRQGRAHAADAAPPWIKYALYAAGGLCAVAVVAAVLVVGKVLTRQPEQPFGTFVFDWPAEQRADAIVMVNSVRVNLPPSGPVEAKCQPGSHRISIQRKGFETYQDTVELKAGEQKAILPEWLPEKQPAAPKEATPDTQLAKSDPPPPPPTPSPPKPTPSPPPTTPTPAPPLTPEPAPKPTEVPKPAPEQPPAPKETVVAKSPAPKVEKVPVPDNAAQQEVLKQLNEAYDWNAAATSADKIRLAKEMLELSKKAQDQPAERFVLLRRAMELAGEGGDAWLMLSAVDAIDNVFVVDSLEVKRRVLTKFAEGASDEARIESLVRSSEGMIRLALVKDRYDVALDVANAIYLACQKPAGRSWRKDTYDYRTEIQQQHERWQQFQQATTALQANPEDPAANLAAGRWYAITKRDWTAALPHLAKSSEIGLRQVAQTEVTSAPADAAAQLKLADAWWDAAQAVQDAALKDAILLHAGTWYEKARGGVNSTVQQQKIENRLKQVEELRNRR